MIEKYELIETSDLKELNEKVNAKLDVGWELYKDPGIVIAPRVITFQGGLLDLNLINRDSGFAIIYYQAVIFRERSND